MAWSIYCTALSAEQATGAGPGPVDALWAPDSPWQPVYFLGFDNTYPFAVAGVAMLLALGGRYRLPEQFITNEFYELDSEKFSTSRGHAVWGTEIAAQLPRDLIRFHLATTSPEFQRSDFSRTALDAGDRTAASPAVEHDRREGRGLAGPRAATGLGTLARGGRADGRAVRDRLRAAAL